MRVVPIDLDKARVLDFNGLKGVNPKDTEGFSRIIEEFIGNHEAAIGGYGEERKVYADSDLFNGEEPRSVHLGIDIWAPAGTEVYAPMRGKIHSFANNSNYLDYGTTIIIEHDGFYTLYGHLSAESLNGLSEGMEIEAGQRIATLGEPSENGGWPSHLHFQLINDMLDMHGDFPGVCKPSERKKWLALCPDPNTLLRVRALQK